MIRHTSVRLNLNIAISVCGVRPVYVFMQSTPIKYLKNVWIYLF